MAQKNGNFRTVVSAPRRFASIRLLSRFLLCLGCAWGPRLAASDAWRFESLGIPVRAGGLMGCIVGPNGQGGEALYFNFNQLSGRLFLVQVDPESGAARQFNAPEGPGAWAMLAGPDERIYLGTWDGALILRFDPRQPDRGIVVVGKPSSTEDYLWQFDTGPEGWIYGCTYPQAKLVRFHPGSGAMEDLGRMHRTEMYARSLAVGPTGKVYVGIGTTQADVVMFDPATGRHQSVLPPELPGAKGAGTAGVSRRADGKVYAECGAHLFRLDDHRAVPVATAPSRPVMKLRDGREVASFGRGEFSLRDPKSGEVVARRFQYAGAGDHIFMVGVGPDDWVYGSTAMPLEVFRFDPKGGTNQHLGAMPGGEVYSMLEHEKKLYLCYYGGAVMNLYDPSKNGWNFGTSPESNPRSFGGVGDGHLRPRAMVRGPDGLIYVGSEPPYGELGGALGVWDPRLNRTIENYRHLVTNQSVVSLAWDPKSGLLFGGSSIAGGGGTKPVAKEAKFFAFDPKHGKKVFETTLLPGAASYPATIATQGRILVAAQDKLFLFDPERMAAVRTNALPASQVDIALGVHGGSGRLVGLTGRGVYVADAETGTLLHRATAPMPIRCGFALVGDAVYFGSKAELWRYHLPMPVGSTESKEP